MYSSVASSSRRVFNSPAGRRSLASSAYFPSPPGPSRQPQSPTQSNASSKTSAPYPSASSKTSPSATHSSPELSDADKDLISRIIRVDQAGELGANWIYRGQKAGSLLRGDTKTAKDVQEMWENEKHHLKTMALVRAQHDVRPTLLWPVWQGLAFGMGMGTALLGREAAMACTEAVETVIGEHYDDQIRALKPLIEKNDHPSLPLLRDVLTEFRDDELEHLDTAVEEGAQKAPGHSLLSAVIGAGCKIAIKVCEKV